MYAHIILMSHLIFLNPDHVTEQEAASYFYRRAARAIVLDAHGQIGILHVAEADYYTIPGGGIDPGEDVRSALVRECKEEVGCEVGIMAELGTTLEYRKDMQFKQISHCYLVRVVGTKGKPLFTPGEIACGYELLWLPYTDALLVLTTNKPTYEVARSYILPRSIAILQASRAYL